MHKLAAFLLPLALLASSAYAATLPGAIPGNSGVSESGAATYSFPLAVPPGTAGVEPKLSLNYSSQEGNGIAGVGWSLGGLSAITRCTVDRAPNTSVRLSFTATDRFCLDGQRLVAVSGTYGANGAEYRTERETFSKIVSSGSAGSGPASFKVWTKAGLIMEYGVSTDARILAEGRAEARVWALNKVSDTSGNYFAVTYTLDAANAEYLPNRITYTGNTTAGTAPQNEIEFQYEARPDPATGYAAGVRVGQASRLVGVLARAVGSLVSDYTLAYDTAPVTGRSRLSSITRCAGNGDCLAPTQFTWLDGQLASYAADQETVTPAGTVNDMHFALGDMNADGRTDALLLKADQTNLNKGVFQQYLAQADGAFSNGQSTAMGTWGPLPNTSPSASRLLLLDVVGGNGTADPYLADRTFSSKWSTALNGMIGNSGFAGVWLLGDIPKYSWAIAADINGDGIADVGGHRVAADYQYEPPVDTLSLAGLGGGNGGYIDITSYGITDPRQSFLSTVDVTGDGLTDVLRYDPAIGRLLVWRSNGTSLDTPLSQTLTTGGSPLDRWFQTADINGDGLADLILHTPANGQLRTWLAKGDGTFITGSISALTTGGLPANTWFHTLDINADGRADIVKYSPTSGNLTYALSLGDGGFDAPATVYLGTGPLPTPHIGPAPYTHWFSPADINGDGVLDWVRYDPALGRIKVNLGQGGVPDQLAVITDGLGAATRLTYKPLTDASVYTKGTGAAYPEQDVQNAMQVVAAVETSNGIGGFARNTYTYAGLKANVAGGGLLGFKSMTVRDEQSGIRTTTEYRQDSPYTGQVAKVTRTASNGTVLGQTTNTWTVIYPGNVTVYPYLQRTIEDSFDLNGVRINKLQTDMGQDSYGNLTSIWKRHYAAADLVNPVKTEWTSNTYDNLTTNWLLGRLRRAVVQDYLTAQQRVSSFEYHATTGLLTKETIEPDAANVQFRLDTTYTHDAFGNRKTATVSSPATGTAAIVARTTTTTYDANGQFPVVTSNALTHSENKTFDPRFGTVKTLTGPNGLTTSWEYDGFGRKTRETRADGTFTVWSYLPCDAACSAYGAYRMVTQVFAPGNVQSAPVTTTYYDALNREVRSATQGFNGTWVYKDTVYDNQGRVQNVSRPYFVGQTIYWITSEYDELGRLVKVIEPDDLDHPVLTVVYNGPTTSRTNRKAQTTTETKNVLGQKVAVTDAMGNVTAYAYDTWGNLATVTAPGNLVTSNVYDLRGRKTQTTDPDLGLWRYEYNALGEIVKQTDAKNQITTMVYDKLGRMVSRVEPGLTSTWVWDTAAKGIGKLTSASTNAGYIRTHSYDTLGRPNATINNHGAGNPLLVSSVAYDAAGRTLTSTYPNGLVIKQVYNAYGYLAEVRNNATNALYWQQNAMDAEGHSLKETTGNGVITDRSYDATNGRLQNITGYKGATQIQGHAYVYDTIGNVTILADGPGSQLEIRGGYAALNRLTNTDIIVNGVSTPQNLTYNALGDITSKAGVGAYTYGDAAHKHAVTQAGGNSYNYDPNGNLLNGAGRSLTWTAWNMPASITSGGTTQSWLYGPEHDRYKLTASGRTTWYLNPSVHQGGHYERTQYTSGTIEHRVTLYGGGKPIGEVLTFDSGAPQTRYFHSDAQGSITAVTNEAGVVITRFRYDPWGKQTLISGSNTGIDQTRQGHTAHEMLDSGLTHMNGRVYDPVLSRFVSADPYVDNPFDLQSLNRYSYVNNNPLGYTDPSGYFKLFGKKWRWWRDKVVKPVVGAWLGYLTFGATQWLVGSSLGGGTFGYAVGTAVGAVAAGVTTSLVSTGSVDGWQYNALSSLLFYGAGEIGQAASNASRVALHATAGCVSVAAAGGDCATGAASAAVGKFTTIATEGWNTGAQFAAATVAGGTASVIGGGKFANGATTAAFGYLFNHCMHNTDCLNPGGYKEGYVQIQDGNGKWMWVPPGIAGEAACGAAAGGSLCGNQSQQINNGISTTAKVIQFLFPQSLAGRAINFIDSVTTYVGAALSGSPSSAAGTIAGDLVTRKVKPYMTNNSNAERIGIATELAVDKTVNGN